MPAKESYGISISLHPLEGVSDFEVSSFGRWVGELKKLSRHAIVLEENKQKGKHCHIALEFNKTTNQDNVKRNFKSYFANSLYTDPRWTTNVQRSICIKAHDDIPGLVGGYYTKDTGEVISISGFNEQELKEGKDRRTAAVVKKDKHICNKMNFIQLMIDKHNSKNANDPGYPEMDDPAQVNECYKSIIRDGYKNYVLIFTKAVREQITYSWKEIIYQL